MPSKSAAPSTDTVSNTHRQSKGLTQKKPDTKLLSSSDDPSYVDLPECDDNRSGGQKITPILLEVSRRCHKVDDSKKKPMFRCLASAGCNGTWSGKNRDKSRVLKHAVDCGWLEQLPGGHELITRAMQVMLKDGKLDDLARQRLRQRLGFSVTHKRTRSDSDPVAFTDAPPVKHVERNDSDPSAAESEEGSSSVRVVKGKLPTGKWAKEALKTLHDDVNVKLTELVANCGLPPSAIGHRSFRDFVSTLNNKVSLPSVTTLEDSIIPSYAVSVRDMQLEYLRTCRDLTITFDGGKLRKYKFWSVHVTTPHNESFCLELNDVSRLSQTADYVSKVLIKVCFNSQQFIIYHVSLVTDISE